MPELKDVLTSLKELNPSTDQFASTLRELCPNFYQVIFDRGHGTATEATKADKTRLETELQGANARITAAEARATEAENRSPDVAKIRKQYDDQISELRGQLKTNELDFKGKLKASAKSRAIADIRKAAVAKGLDPDWVDNQVADLPDNKWAKRLRPTETGDGVEILADGKDIPMQAEKPTEAIVQELYDSAPPKWRTSNADGGAGSGSGNGTGGTQGKGFYDGVRSGVKEEEKRTAGSKPASERLGAVR